MFVSRLSPVQKEQLVVLAHKLTMADGVDAPEEEAALESLKQEAGFTGPVPMSKVLDNIDVSGYDTKVARIAAMLEVLVLAFVDEDLHPAEIDFLGRVAGHMDFSQEEFNPMVEWAFRFGFARRTGDIQAQEALTAAALEMMSREA